MKPWLLPFLYYAFLIGLSSIPRLKLPEPDGVPTDKYFHVLAYGGLGFLLARAERRWWLAILIGVGLGILDETYQRFVPGRSCSVNDWIADCLGVALGVLAWHLILKIFSALRKKD